MTLVNRAREYAHYLLAAIRFINGALALVVPGTLAKRVDVDVNHSPGILYFERMFGIRTILIAWDLVGGGYDRTVEALRIGRIIHASDATSAALAGLRGNLGRRAAVMTTAISLVNLLLALIAKPRPPRARRINPFGR
jgi:hypothetical protein